MTTAVDPTLRQRWRRRRWLVAGAAVIVALSALTVYLTAPRPGGLLDPSSTSPDGARALVSLLRDGTVVYPRGDTVVAPGDRLTVLVARGREAEVQKLLTG